VSGNAHVFVLASLYHCTERFSRPFPGSEAFCFWTGHRVPQHRRIIDARSLSILL